MLARHAEALFWCGRYLERAEDAARMLDVTYHGLLESHPAEAAAAWQELLATLSLSEDYAALDRPYSAGPVSRFLVLERSNPGCITIAVQRARENARSVRELISTELWEAINGFHLELLGRDLVVDLDRQPHELYALVRRRCQTANGVAAETMSRDDGWRFLMLGWMLERAEMTCRLLQVRADEMLAGEGVGGYHALTGVLKSASAAEAFRMAQGAALSAERVLEFLVLSRQFPRSLLYCVRQAEKDLTRLGSADRPSRPQRLIGRIRADLEFRDVTELTDGNLDELLDEVQRGVRDVADAVNATYFRNAEALDLHPVRYSPAGT